MDILKISIDWAKNEVFSSLFFILIGIIFLFASLGFWQLGKTNLAKSYIIPMLIGGILLLIIGVGLLYNYQSKITEFPTTYNEDSNKFIKTQTVYVDKTLNDYKNIVFTIIPIIIAICAILIIFIENPTYRASLITTIAFMVVLLIIDGNAGSRLIEYKKLLMSVKIK